MVDTLVTREPIKVIADIIQTELELDALVDPKDASKTIARVMVYNQRFKPPTTEGMYVVVSYVSGVAIGNNNYITDVESAGTEIQELAMNEVIQIDVMSSNEEARQRKEEVIMALNSIYAAQVCDENRMQLARIPSAFNDLSGLEGSSQMNRYTMTVILKALYRKTKDASYYDKGFTPEVHHDPKALTEA